MKRMSMRAFQKSCSSIAAGVVLFGMFFPVLACTEPGITSNKIVLGQSAAFTGSPSEEVKQATAGMIIYFDRVNEQGRIFGRKIILESPELGVMQAFPNTKNIIPSKSKEFQDMLKVKADLSDSYSALEGFVAAKVLVEGLRKAGPHPTRDGLVAALESLKGFDLGGINLNFSPTSRDGSDFIKLTVIGRNGTVVR